MKGLSPKLQARLMKAASAGRSAAKKVRDTGMTGKLATVGVTTAGGVMGGALNGVFEGKRILGAQPSTVAGVAATGVSLFLKGEAGSRVTEVAAGMLALSAGTATQKAVRKAKVNDFLDSLAGSPKRDALEERRKSHQNLTPEERAVIEARGNRLPPGGVRSAGEAGGTQLSAAELRAMADGTA